MKKYSKIGYTLVEMMVVVGIIALLTVIAMPELKGVKRRTALQDTAEQLRQAILEARSMAIAPKGSFQNPKPYNIFEVRMNKDISTWKNTNKGDNFTSGRDPSGTDEYPVAIRAATTPCDDPNTVMNPEDIKVLAFPEDITISNFSPANPPPEPADISAIQFPLASFSLKCGYNANTPDASPFWEGGGSVFQITLQDTRIAQMKESGQSEFMYVNVDKYSGQVWVSREGKDAGGKIVSPSFAENYESSYYCVDNYSSSDCSAPSNKVGSRINEFDQVQDATICVDAAGETPQPYDGNSNIYTGLEVAKTMSRCTTAVSPISKKYTVLGFRFDNYKDFTFPANKLPRRVRVYLTATADSGESLSGTDTGADIFLANYNIAQWRAWPPSNYNVVNHYFYRYYLEKSITGSNVARRTSLKDLYEPTSYTLKRLGGIKKIKQGQQYMIEFSIVAGRSTDADKSYFIDRDTRKFATEGLWKVGQDNSLSTKPGIEVWRGIYLVIKPQAGATQVTPFKFYSSEAPGMVELKDDNGKGTGKFVRPGPYAEVLWW